MKNNERKIIETLKQEMEFSYEDGYCQWIMGVSIRKLIDNISDSESVLINRLIVKTNESPYVDGMDKNKKHTFSDNIVNKD